MSTIQLVEDPGRQAGPSSLVPASASGGEGLGRVAVMTERQEIGKVVQAAPVGDLPDVVHLFSWLAASYTLVPVSVECCLPGFAPGCGVELPGVG